MTKRPLIEQPSKDKNLVEDLPEELIIYFLEFLCETPQTLVRALRTCKKFYMGGWKICKNEHKTYVSFSRLDLFLKDLIWDDKDFENYLSMCVHFLFRNENRIEALNLYNFRCYSNVLWVLIRRCNRIKKLKIRDCVFENNDGSIFKLSQILELNQTDNCGWIFDDLEELEADFFKPHLKGFFKQTKHKIKKLYLTEVYWSGIWIHNEILNIKTLEKLVLPSQENDSEIRSLETLDKIKVSRNFGIDDLPKDISKLYIGKKIKDCLTTNRTRLPKFKNLKTVHLDFYGIKNEDLELVPQNIKKLIITIDDLPKNKPVKLTLDGTRKFLSDEKRKGLVKLKIIYIKPLKEKSKFDPLEFKKLNREFPNKKITVIIVGNESDSESLYRTLVYDVFLDN